MRTPFQMTHANLRNRLLTIWVNKGGGAIGRFSRFGIDVHHDTETQIALGKQCMDCTHSRPTQEEWLRFKSSMVAAGVKARMLDQYDVHVAAQIAAGWREQKGE